MIFNCTVQGSSHKTIGKVCQDSSLTWQDPDTGLTVAIVSDGHGGEKYIHSNLGSWLACEVTLQTVREFACYIQQEQQLTPSVLQNLFTAIYTRWSTSILDEDPEAPLYHYGCTLMAYVQTTNWWLAFQIGDGKLVVKNRVVDGAEAQIFSQPVPWDDRCILNVTTSLCDADACHEFRYASGTECPEAVFLGSDGIDDTFSDGELLYRFYQHLLDCVSEDGLFRVRLHLPDVLDHYSEVGSHDDMSVAVVINSSEQ